MITSTGSLYPTLPALSCTAALIHTFPLVAVLPSRCSVLIPVNESLDDVEPLLLQLIFVQPDGTQVSVPLALYQLSVLSASLYVSERLCLTISGFAWPVVLAV